MKTSETIEETAEVQSTEESRGTDREGREEVREAIGEVETGSVRSGTAPTNNAPFNGL